MQNWTVLLKKLQKKTLFFTIWASERDPLGKLVEWIDRTVDKIKKFLGWKFSLFTVTPSLLFKYFSLFVFPIFMVIWFYFFNLFFALGSINCLLLNKIFFFSTFLVLSVIFRYSQSRHTRHFLNFFLLDLFLTLFVFFISFVTQIWSLELESYLYLSLLFFLVTGFTDCYLSKFYFILGYSCFVFNLSDLFLTYAILYPSFFLFVNKLFTEKHLYPLIFGLVYLLTVENPPITFLLSEAYTFQALPEDIIHSSKNRDLLIDNTISNQLLQFDSNLTSDSDKSFLFLNMKSTYFRNYWTSWTYVSR